MYCNARSLAPYGVAPETQEFLNQPVRVEGVEKQTFKLYEVMLSRVLLESFDETQFPFGAVLLGCAQNGYREKLGEFMGKILAGINHDQGERVVAPAGMCRQRHATLRNRKPLGDSLAVQTLSFPTYGILHSDNDRCSLFGATYRCSRKKEA